jgi:hypothetical protein
MFFLTPTLFTITLPEAYSDAREAAADETGLSYN